MSRKLFHPLSFIVALAILGLTIASAGSAAPAPVPSATPRLTAVNASPGTLTVSGDGFAHGGNVFVALYDSWGVALHETRWVRASEPIIGLNGSHDPALGYRAGGTIREVFDGLCGEAIMVRAYDQKTGVWTNVLDVVSTSFAPATFEPFTGLDPAREYRAGC